MNLKNNTKDGITHRFYTFAIGAAYLIWIAVFHKFLLAQKPLYKDAHSYFNQIKYFIINLSEGTIPFWNHWTSYGIPNEFFFRRFCEFNPAYLVLVFLNKLTIPFEYTYLPFFTAYFFIGTIFFYITIKKVTRNTLTAYISLLLILFSSLGTRSFDSFILLVLVPMLGFFYCFISLFIKAKVKHLIGSTYFLIILLNTYIPFYFMVIFVSFMLSLFIVYPKKTGLMLKNFLPFMKSKKLLIITCTVSIFLCCLPALHMFTQGKADIMLPKRQATVVNKTDSLTVSKQTISAGGIVAPYLFENMISNYSDFELEVVYIPLFGLFIIFLGIFNKIRKTYIFLITWFILIYLIGLNNATPIYPALYKNLFFFKYFRNSIFFTWIALIPIVTALCGLILKDLLETAQNTSVSPRVKTLSVSISFILFGVLLLNYNVSSISSYIFLIASYGFVLFLIIKPHFIFSKPSIIILSSLIIITSCVPYYYLNLNYPDRPIRPLVKNSLLSFEFVRPKSVRDKIGSYVQTPAFSQSFQNIKHKILSGYAYHRLIIYDRTQPINSQNINTPMIERAMNQMTNIAYIDTTDKQYDLNTPNAPQQAQTLTANRSDIEILKFSPNHIVFKTHFQKPKFIVYTDAYDPHWTGTINGKTEKILKTNLSFKGILVPQGENIVELKYVNTVWFFISYLVWTIFLLYFLTYIILCFKRNKRDY